MKTLIPLFASTLFGSIVVAALLTAPLSARAADPIDASARASTASLVAPSAAGGVLVAGSLEALQLSGHAVVATVEAAGDGSVIVLRGVSDAGSASIRLAGTGIRNLGVAAGTVVDVVATGTGFALITAGKVIAFVPNEVGRALVHESRLAETGGAGR